MLREFSAGGIVIDDAAGRDPPQGRPAGHWALPKGAIDPGERGVDAAVREVLEETAWWPSRCGAWSREVRLPAGGERIFKVVTFWVMAAVGGELGAIAEEMRVEVAEAAWVALADAPSLLAYRGERGS